MHKQLRVMHESLPEGSALYRFCFYDTLNKAKLSMQSDFESWESYILRFKKEQIHELGFNWQWDEGFKQGEAHLFWINEDETKTRWSDTGVPFEDVEVLDQGEWVSLDLFFPQLLQRLNPPLIIENEGAEQENAEEKYELGFFRILVRKLFKRGR
ncbi:hypothetical protein MI353_09735 [Alteromonas sp. MCA-1]|uniref:hypothetical protein n=2 Tax=unclassified Alteromonas TaxID=2614992 RepID=UPI0035120CC0|nr:hypothetical protein [Alteromonas sp. MCA-1]